MDPKALQAVLWANPHIASTPRGGGGQNSAARLQSQGSESGRHEGPSPNKPASRPDSGRGDGDARNQ